MGKSFTGLCVWSDRSYGGCGLVIIKLIRSFWYLLENLKYKSGHDLMKIVVWLMTTLKVEVGNVLVSRCCYALL